jgi:hypothetical protein
MEDDGVFSRHGDHRASVAKCFGELHAPGFEQ